MSDGIKAKYTLEDMARILNVVKGDSSVTEDTVLTPENIGLANTTLQQAMENLPAVVELAAAAVQYQDRMEKVLVLLPEMRKAAYTVFSHMDEAIGQMHVDSKNSNWPKSTDRIKLHLQKQADAHENALVENRRIFHSKYNQAVLMLGGSAESLIDSEPVDADKQDADPNQEDNGVSKRRNKSANDGGQPCDKATKRQNSSANDGDQSSMEIAGSPAQEKPSDEAETGPVTQEQPSEGTGTGPAVQEQPSEGTGAGPVGQEQPSNETGTAPVGQEQPSGEAGTDTQEQEAAKDCNEGQEEEHPHRKGSTLVATGPADKTVVCLPEDCEACPNRENCERNAALSDCRIVFEAEIRLVQVNYYKGTVKCPLKDNQVVKGEHPDNVTGRTQYGIHMWAFVVCLFGMGFVSVNRIQAMIRAFFHIDGMSTATINNIIHRAGEMGVIYYNYIRLKVREAFCIFSDETSSAVRRDGKVTRTWIHCAVTDMFTYLYYSPHRGFDAIREDGVLLDLIVYLMHDCWKSYFKLDRVTHILCGAHLVRELAGVFESSKTHVQTWAKDMKDLIDEMLKKKTELVHQGFELGYSGKLEKEEDFPQCKPEEIAEFKARYVEIVRAGFAFNDESFETAEVGKKGAKQTKAVNLLVRLRDHMDAYLAWIIDVRLPFCNNLAEQSFRGQKVWEHVSHLIQTEVGLVIRLILCSIVQSAQKHGLSGYDAIIKMLEGMPPEEFFGSKVAEDVKASAPERDPKTILPGKSVETGVEDEGEKAS